MRLALFPDCRVQLFPAFLSGEESSQLEETLRHGEPWQRREIVLFGRRIEQPRLVSWGGELPYRYSGQTLSPRALPPHVARVLERVNHATKQQFNHVLLNRYRDGCDSMGWHSDDEPELGENPAVATLSLGAVRRFCLRPRTGPKPWRSVSVELSPGSLLLMTGATQHRYSHCLPKQPKLEGERISLTFRFVRNAPAPR